MVAARSALVVGVVVYLASFGALANDAPPVSTDPQCTEILAAAPDPKAEALTAAAPFNAYFSGLTKVLKEREYLLELSALALIAKEHLLLMGPPGNAKSMLADQALGGIIDHATQKSSYYKIQMTPETTLSETHGPLDYKSLTKTNKYERIYEEGMLLSRNGFIDEIFDGRANSMRNVLGLLNERAHAQGPRITKGKIETVIAATNRYISEVYEKTRDDSPKALLDRFAFSAFVPGDFESTESAISLIREAKRAQPTLPKLTFQQLDAVRAMVPEVEIPEYVAKFLTLVRGKIKAETEAIEQSSLKAYTEKLKNGEEAQPPYRATKYQSPRTLGKAAGILRAIVVRDWLATGGKRPLRAGIEDVKKLEVFFTLNGPSKDFIQTQLAQSTNPHEKAQLTAILQERDIFERNFQQVLGQMNETVYKYALTDIQAELSGEMLPGDRERVGKKLAALFVDIQKKRVNSKKLTDLSGEEIGLDHVHTFLVSSLKELMGDKADALVTEVIKTAEIERQNAIAAKLAADEAARVEAARLLEIKLKAEAEAARIAEERRLRMNTLTATYTGANTFGRLMAIPPAPAAATGILREIPGTEKILSYAPGSSILLSVVDADGAISTIPLGKPSKLSSLLNGKMGKVTDILVPDSNHFIVVADRQGWVFDLDGTPIGDFTLSSPGKFAYALNPDRSQLLVLDIVGSRVNRLDWKSGKLLEQVKLQEKTSAGERTEEYLDEFAEGDGIVVAGNDTIYFSYGIDRYSLRRIDLTKGELGAVETESKLAMQLIPTPQFSDRAFAYSTDERYTLTIRETFLGKPGQSADHVISTGYVFRSDYILGIEIIEDGAIAVVALNGTGLMIIDLVSNKVINTTFFGDRNVSKPIDLGNGRIGFWHQNGSQYFFQVAVPTKKQP